MVARYLQDVKSDPRITPAVINTVIGAESAGRQDAVSPKGALGMMQLMPSTARDLGVDPMNREQNVAGGTKYLNYLIGQTGNLPDALAAYNMGLAAFKRRGRNNLPKETIDYVEKIKQLLSKHQGEQTSVAEAPVNQQDPTPKSESEESISAPTQSSGMQFSGYEKPISPPSRFLGKNNPITMVENLLQDPMSLSRGEGRNMAGGGVIKKALAGFSRQSLSGMENRGREIINGSAEDFAARARDQGFQANVVHSGSAAGPSSYVDIYDPMTGRRLTKQVRFSGHDKGDFNRQEVIDIVNPEQQLAIEKQMLEMRNLGPSEGFLKSQETNPEELRRMLNNQGRRRKQLDKFWNQYESPIDPDAIPMAGGGLIKKAISAMSNREADLLRASKNAEKMLGLPPGNTPADRAKAMGFGNTTHYHGTGADISEFRKGRLGGQPELGISLTDDPNVASEFAESMGGQGQNVLPLLYRAKKRGHLELPGDIGTLEVEQTLLDALGNGFDAVKMTNYTTPGGKSGKNIVFVKDPAQIRSKFAAFDPAKIESKDILAGIGGIGALGAARNPDSLSYAGGGSVETLKAPPQNQILGALSRAAKGVDEFTKPAREIPYAGWLVPSFESLGNVLEDASYGMPLTTGRGMTTGLKPEVGFAALDASQLPGIVSMGKGMAGKLARMPKSAPVKAQSDVIESIFGPSDEYSRAKAAWDAEHNMAFGGMIRKKKRK